MQPDPDLPIVSFEDRPYPLRVDFVVVFVDKTECRYLRWLKRGFRHCFVAVRSEDRWLICDPLKNRFEFSIVGLPADFDLSTFYYNEGHTVVIGKSHRSMATGIMLPEIFTCVAVVKRIIGLRSHRTLTPWQLFCLLKSMGDDWRVIGTHEAGQQLHHLPNTARYGRSTTESY